MTFDLSTLFFVTVAYLLQDVLLRVTDAKQRHIQLEVCPRHGVFMDLGSTPPHGLIMEVSVSRRRKATISWRSTSASRSRSCSRRCYWCRSCAWCVITS